MNFPGTLIQRGSEGDAVKAIQKRLGVQETGVFGPTTEECVTNFQRSHGLEPDGIVGQKTWNALFATEPAADLGDAALKEAKQRVGVKEQPLGSNRGPQVDQYLGRVGLPPPPGNPWCLAFVYFCVDEAAKKLGKPNPLPKTGSCSALFRWAKEHGRLVARPEVGDVFLCIGGDTGHFHTGFVAGPIVNERFPTIEGNSNRQGSPNGIGVVRRTPGRHLPSCHYVRI